MRIAVMIAASVLVGGCSQGVGGDAEQTEPSVSAPARHDNVDAAHRPRRPRRRRPNRRNPGAAVADVIAFIESGHPSDVGQFHTATREGTATQLGDDVAFTTPSGKSNCMTDSKNFGGALACLVDLTIPPLQPPDVYGQWKGDWVDFAGPSIEIGSAHGDPGRFGNGTGPELPYGETLAFGDYRCRSDPAGLYCVNYAHQIGRPVQRRGHRPVRVSAEGDAACRHRREVQLLSRFQATPFCRSSGSTPSANQYASSRCG